MAGRQPYRSGGAQRSRRHSAGSYPTIADQASSLYAPVSASIRAVSAAVSASEAKSPAQRRRPSMFGRATRILSRSRAGSTPSEVDEQASALVKKPARNTGSVVRPASSRAVWSRRPRCRCAADTPSTTAARSPAEPAARIRRPSRLPQESSTLGGAHRSSPRPGPLLARGVLRTGAPHRSRRVRRPPSGNPWRHQGPPSSMRRACFAAVSTSGAATASDQSMNSATVPICFTR